MTTEAPVAPPTKRYVRHWKERYKKGMPLIFIKRLQLDGDTVVVPGDVVTPELRAKLGEHRLKTWWMAKVVGSRVEAERMGFTVNDPHALKDVPCGLNVGDDKTLETAKAKFDQQPNFGGKPQGGKGKKG